MKTLMRSAVVVTGAVAALAAGVLPASAAAGDPNPSGNGQTLQPITCTGLGDILLRTNSNNSGDKGGWGVAKIVAGGTGSLIPTSFTFEAYDQTTGHDLFPAGTEVKGGGNANHEQGPVLTCTQSMTGTLADFLEPGDQVPEGATLADTVIVTLTATAIHID